MRARAAPRESPEAGFTLIELLTVMIIIGILAAVAIPIFLNQRSRGYDTQAKSDLRQLALNEETYLVDQSTYGTIAQIVASGYELRVSHGVTLTVLDYSANAYCLSGKAAGSAITWYYDSQAGGLQPRGAAACPVTTSGTAGDSITG